MKKKRHRMQDDGYVGDSPPSRSSAYSGGHNDYDNYDSRWGNGEMRSPSSRFRDYPSTYGGEDKPAPGPYDSPGPDPYASPPDESSEDEFAETLYSLVGDELMDPNVSAADKEVGNCKLQPLCLFVCTTAITVSLSEKYYEGSECYIRLLIALWLKQVHSTSDAMAALGFCSVAPCLLPALFKFATEMSWWS